MKENGYRKKMRPEKWHSGSARKILRLAQKRFFEPCPLITALNVSQAHGPSLVQLLLGYCADLTTVFQPDIESSRYTFIRERALPTLDRHQRHHVSSGTSANRSAQMPETPRCGMLQNTLCALLFTAVTSRMLSSHHLLQCPFEPTAPTRSL